MYRNFYGFAEKPFDLTPDPKFLYLSPVHIEALASITYGIHERRGLIVMVGEVGTGKTLLLNAALDRLDENTQVAFIFNTDVTFGQLLRMILVDLALAKPSEPLTKSEALHRLNDFAVKQLPWGHNLALIVDEAQNLDRSCLENLRLLSNLETRKHKLIQIVLSGQPELDAKLNRPELRQLAQRISLKRSITPLIEQETYEYIRHRLRIAKYGGPSLFSSGAQQLIWEYSAGIPRKINMLCDNALLIGYGLEKKTIKTPILEEVVNDLGWKSYLRNVKSKGAGRLAVHQPQPQTKRSFPRFAMAGVPVLVVCLALIVLFLLGNSPHKSEQVPPPAYGGVIQLKIPKDVNNPAQSPTIQQAALPSVPLGTQTNKKEPAANPGPPPRAQGKATPKKSRSVVVRSGDNLFRIVLRSYGRYDRALVSTVLRANPEIKNPDQIKVGQVITLPEMNK